MSQDPIVMSDIEAEAAAMGDPTRQELVHKVSEMTASSRASAAVNLLVSGATYEDIAKVLAYKNTGEVKRAVWNAIGSIELDQDEINRERKKMRMRLEQMIAVDWPRVQNRQDPDQLAYQRFVLAVMDRQAKLMGLDAPSQSIVYNPSKAEIEQHVQQVRQVVIQQAGDIEGDVLGGSNA